MIKKHFYSLLSKKKFFLILIIILIFQCYFIHFEKYFLLLNQIMIHFEKHSSKERQSSNHLHSMNEMTNLRKTEY